MAVKYLLAEECTGTCERCGNVRQCSIFINIERRRLFSPHKYANDIQHITRRGGLIKRYTYHIALMIKEIDAPAFCGFTYLSYIINRYSYSVKIVFAVQFQSGLGERIS